MPDGTVGGGHQNRYLPTGFAHGADHDVVKYHKEKERDNVDWKDSRCWNAGTPIWWPADINTRETVRAGVLKVIVENVKDENGKPIPIMVTKNESNKTVDYHPLIQFYNVVTARLINHGLHEELKNVHDPKIAVIIWKYLERTYLKFSESPAFEPFLAEITKELKARLLEIEREKMAAVK